MGCAGSKAQAGNQPNALDIQLMEAAEASKKHFKVLLLGAGESGKSTLCKQIKLIHKGTLSNKEHEMYAHAIRRNAIECMQTLLEVMQEQGIHVESANRAAADRLRAVESDQELTPELGRDIVSLWQDPTIKQVWELRSKFWILDAAPYYFEHAPRLAAPNYTCSEEDVVMSRVVTTGIGITEIQDGPYRYSVVDVGGQRNERKKWIHCFDDVKAIMFLTSLAGYNQVMFEDSSKNRLQESLDLFEQIVGNPIFRDTPVFVLFNKKDLFEEMIQQTSLRVCFPQYDGPERDAVAAVAFLERQYKSVLAKHCPGKPLKASVMAAKHRPEVERGWSEIRTSIMQAYRSEDKENQASAAAQA